MDNINDADICLTFIPARITLKENQFLKGSSNFKQEYMKTNCTLVSKNVSKYFFVNIHSKKKFTAQKSYPSKPIFLLLWKMARLADISTSFAPTLLLLD